MTLEKALVHLDMVDLFKTKCQPGVRTADVIKWLQTFPRLQYHMNNWWPQISQVTKLRARWECSAKHGGASFRRNGTKKHTLPSLRKRPSRGVGIDTGSAGHRARAFIPTGVDHKID